MADLGITFSMNHTGNVGDNNAATESLFSSIKTLRTARKVYRKRGDARADVFDDIIRFHNRRRRNPTLGYLSPVEFEETEPAAGQTSGSDEFPMSVHGTLPVSATPEPTADSCYAGRTTTFVLTGVRSYRSIMSWLSRPTQPLVTPEPIDSGSLVA